MSITLVPLDVHLVQNFDLTFDGAFPNGDKNPTLLWNLTGLASLLGSPQGTPITFNARALLGGTAGALATISMVAVSGSGITGWTAAGAGNNCTNPGTVAAGGVFFLRATYLSANVDSPPISWSIVASNATFKWHPGHYSAVNGQWFPGNTIANFTEVMDSTLANQDHIQGFKIAIPMSTLNPSKGVYDYSSIRALLTRLKTQYDVPKRLIVVLLTTTLNNQKITSNTSTGLCPGFILQNSLVYGASPFPGISGVWGPSSGGVSTGSYAIATWRKAVMDELIALVTDMGATFDSEPYFEGLGFQEVFGEGNGFGATPSDGTCNDTAMNTQAERLFQAALAAWPTTSIFHENSFEQNQSTTIALQDYMMANGIATSSADTRGHSKNATGLGNWGLDTYAGKIGGGPDMRGQTACMMDVESNDLGGSGSGLRLFNGNPQDTIDALNLDYWASHAFWVWMPTNTNGTNPPNACLWPALSALLKTSPLIHTTKPPGYRS